MKTVVITGSARGFGLEMLKKFRENSYNTIICDINESALKEALETLELMNYEGKVLAYKVDVTDEKIQISFSEVGNMEIWKKGEVIQYIHPTTGKNSMLRDAMGNHYLFNSKGQIAKGCKKMVLLYENMANGIVKDIEKNL